MPCYQDRTTSVRLEAANSDLLRKALESLGCTSVSASERGHITFYDSVGNYGSVQNGTMRISSSSNLALDPNALKRAYSGEVVKATARKHGWQLKTQYSAVQEQQQFILTKRRFS